MPRYKIYESGNKVIAVSSFAGKAVRGIAKCDPSDTFSPEIGRQLAEARCNVNVADKRERYAADRLKDAIAWYNEASAYMQKQLARFGDATKKHEEAKASLAAILETI